jgi:EAL domain-containing protein (putative c-di-GMP-specific phosphodiesterase class I)
MGERRRRQVDLAHRLGLKTVAEGVETEAALRFLLDARCDVMQGFHFSQPMARNGIPACYRKNRS